MGVHVLGVRHHGPGSARSVAEALAELRPDAVVIEGAPELDDIAFLAGDPAMVPPVAALVYDVATPRFASFYPMAVFSPEWVALRWALEAGVPVRFADLPMANVLALQAEESTLLAERGSEATDPPPPAERGSEATDPPPPAERGSEATVSKPDATDLDGAAAEPAHDPMELARQDPIALLARAAGQEDPERWWEDAVENHGDTAPSRFAHVLEAMREVRAARPELDDEENRRREAAMRKVIRQVAAEHETVVVVCGAFHAPALEPASFPSASADNKLLTKLPRTKVAATWTPWTNGRLALSSGYGAGVEAPGWYHHLFTTAQADAEDVEAGWLVRTARELRSENLDAAPASVVEAVRLAEALAAVRGRPEPGLAELDDAALAVLAGGSEERLTLVRHRLFVGDALGEVPESTPMVPLASDLARTTKTLRLKQSAARSVVELDLRKDTGLAKSIFFHRLRLLGIDWAEPVGEVRTTGTFKEAWTLEWQPSLAVAVIEASLYGTSIADAADARLAELAGDADLGGLSTLVERSFVADLAAGREVVVARLGEASAHTHDVRELLATIEPLARTVRYGNVRGIDTVALGDLLRVLLARVTAGLRAGVQALDDDLATTTRDTIESAHRGLQLLADDELTEPWLAALAEIEEDVHGAVSGRVDRLLLDAGRRDPEEAAARMSRRLSSTWDAQASAAWLESFLAGDAVLLIHDPRLLSILDEWVTRIGGEQFSDVLPLLRRTFSAFSGPERAQVADRLKSLVARGVDDVAPAAVDTPALDRALPAMLAAARLIGLGVRA